MVSWAEKVWLSRKDPEDEQEDPEPKEEDQKEEVTEKVDSNIEGIKDDSFNLLAERLSDKSTEISEMLNKISGTPESDEIDANKHFKRIIAELEAIIDLVFCSNLRINKEKTSIDIVLRLKQYYQEQYGEVYADNGISKSGFTKALLRFMKE